MANFQKTQVGTAHGSGYWVLLYAMGIFYLLAGVNHFWHPATYLAVMPPYIPWPGAMVAISGVAEILGGIGVMIPDGFVFSKTRKLAAWGLVALLIAIWPVHIDMCLHPGRFPGIPLWAIWLRPPLQVPLMVWAWWYSRS